MTEYVIKIGTKWFGVVDDVNSFVDQWRHASMFDDFESAQKIASEINGTVCLVAAPHPVIK